MTLCMGAHQVLTQVGNGREVGIVDHQLVRIGAAVMPDGERFSAPDELGPAMAKPFPAPACQVGGLPQFGTVPTFHGQDGEAIAYAPSRDIK